jgi:hypothetical protein
LDLHIAFEKGIAGDGATRDVITVGGQTMRKSISYFLAFIVYAAIFLASSAISKFVMIVINGANIIPEGPWDYIVGVITSAVGGAAGVGLAFMAIVRWFDIRSSRVAWLWVACLIFLWLFALLGMFTGNDPAWMVATFTAELASAAYFTRMFSVETYGHRQNATF